MKKTLLISLMLLVFALFGCGQTNYLEWTKASDSNSGDLETAKIYIDNAQYTKATSLLSDYLQDNPTDTEANILYGQALMGEADVDLAAIMAALTRETTHESPVVKMELLVADSNRSKIYTAADKFITYRPTDTSDKIIASLCCMAAHSSALKESFGGLGTDLDSLDALNDALDVTTEYNAFKNIQGGSSSKYIYNSFVFMSSLIKDEELNDAIVSMNDTLDLVDQAINANGGTALWVAAKELFGY